MRRLGAKSIAALIVFDREVAWQILSLNTETVHNLKERALNVEKIRPQELAGAAGPPDVG